MAVSSSGICQHGIARTCCRRFLKNASGRDRSKLPVCRRVTPQQLWRLAAPDSRRCRRYAGTGLPHPYAALSVIGCRAPFPGRSSDERRRGGRPIAVFTDATLIDRAATCGGPCRSRYDLPEGRSRRGPRMSATSNSLLADREQLIADLHRQLAGCRAERDEALQRETATAEVLQIVNSSPGDLATVFDTMLEKPAGSVRLISVLS
jgi:hypothetical protein